MKGSSLALCAYNAAGQILFDKEKGVHMDTGIQRTINPQLLAALEQLSRRQTTKQAIRAACSALDDVLLRLRCDHGTADHTLAALRAEVQFIRINWVSLCHRTRERS